MGGIREIKHGDAVQKKCAAIDLSVAAHIHVYLARVELPHGMRQLAGGDGAVVDQIMLRADLVDNLASKGKRSSRSKNHLVAAKDQSGGSGHIVEAPGFEIQIVCAMRRPNVIVIGTAVEREVSGSRRFPGVGVVGGFVGPQYVGSVIDFNRTVQLVDRTFLFLLDGANGADVSFFLLRSGRQRARRGGSGRRLFRRDLRTWLRGNGICRRQLAGN